MFDNGEIKNLTISKLYTALELQCAGENSWSYFFEEAGINIIVNYSESYIAMLVVGRFSSFRPPS